MNADKNDHPHRRQQGAALIVALLVLVVVAAAILLDRLNATATPAPFGNRESGESLVRAKDALIAWAAAHPDTPGLLPFPDRNDDPTPDYDGTADCVAPGAIGPGDLLGRFPIQGEQAGCATAIGISGTVEDIAGEQLWYAVSRNLVRGGGGGPINPDIGDQAVHPWLTVRNQAGTAVSNRVAAVIISPGPALTGQDRSAIDANPAVEYPKYLESVTIGPDTFSNTDSDGCLDDAAGCAPAYSGEDFIIYPKTTDKFNDRLVFITIDELMRAVEDRALGEAAHALKSYRGAGDTYPWLAPFSDPQPKVQGFATGGSATSLSDTSAFFLTDGVVPGDVVRNLTDGSTRPVAAVGSENDLTLLSDGLLGGVSNIFSPGDAYVIEAPGKFDGVPGTLAGFLPITYPGQIFQTGFTVNWNYSGEKNSDTYDDGDVNLIPEIDDVDNSGFSVPAGDVTILPANGECRWTTTKQVNCHGIATIGGYIRPDNGLTVDRTIEVWFNFVADTTTTTDPTSTGARLRTHTFNGPNNGPVTALPPPDLPQEDWTVQVTDTNGTNTGWRRAVRDTSTDLNITISDIQYAQIDAQDSAFDLPSWFTRNNWHYFVHAVVSGANAPVSVGISTGDGACTPPPAPSDDACLTMQYDSAGTPVDVRDDVEALVIGAGPTLSALSQDRINTPVLFSDYFETPNIDGDLVLGRAVRTSFDTTTTFNDQIRAVPP